LLGYFGGDLKDFDFLFSSLSDENQGDKPPQNLPVLYLVEDDQVLGKIIQKYLKKSLGLEVVYYANPTECLEFLDRKYLGIELEKRTPFCLISDISFSEGSTDGLLLIDLLREKGHHFVSLVMTGFASIETAIMATRKGVFHYLTKPFELEVLSDLVVKALTLKLGYTEDQIRVAVSEKVADSSSQGSKYSRWALEIPTEKDIFCGMIGRSQKMKNVFDRIKKVSNSDSTIMITGESGTGKELVAKAIHNLSARKSNELVSVNCGAIPSELLESELFGHVRGAFTGAISDRKGRFEMADKGSIFLDEIGDMPLLLQVKLLRVLQSREIERVGGRGVIPIDTRIITATHRNLEASVSEGNFREDLFYRLNVIPVKLPSLRERKEDIPLLISYFLSRFISADGRNNIELDDDVLETLINYSWPGNVRELENVIERLVILKGGNIVKMNDLPSKFLDEKSSNIDPYSELITLPENGIDLKATLSDIENSLILQALTVTEGNKNRASKLLSMNRTTLIEKMKKKGLMSPEVTL
jgi:DNA-binding NtrC family response regulator